MFKKHSEFYAMKNMNKRSEFSIEAAIKNTTIKSQALMFNRQQQYEQDSVDHTLIKYRENSRTEQEEELFFQHIVSRWHLFVKCNLSKVFLSSKNLYCIGILNINIGIDLQPIRIQHL